MNRLSNRGFSLIELIGVIAILGLVMIIVATNGLGAFENAKQKLRDEDEKVVIESAKVLMTDVLFCDEEINSDLLENASEADFAYINGFTSGTVSCSDLQNKAKSEGLIITLDYLIDNNYVSGSEIEKNKGKSISYKGNIVSENDIEISNN